MSLHLYRLLPSHRCLFSVRCHSGCAGMRAVPRPGGSRSPPSLHGPNPPHDGDSERSPRRCQRVQTRSVAHLPNPTEWPRPIYYVLILKSVEILYAVKSMCALSTDGARRSGRRVPCDGRLLRGGIDSFEVGSILASIFSVGFERDRRRLGRPAHRRASATAPEPATHRLVPRHRPTPDPSKVDNIEPLMNQSTRTSFYVIRLILVREYRNYNPFIEGCGEIRPTTRRRGSVPLT